MADATVRVSGAVLNVDVRTGVSQRTGEPYRITSVRVLVEDTGIADVQLPQALADDLTPYKGSLVDLLCDVTVYNGRAQLRALAEVRALASV